MLDYIEYTCKRFGNILKEEKIFFEKSIKQLISPKQIKLNTLYKIDSSNNDILTQNITEEKLSIGNEIKSICSRVLNLIDDYLLKNIADVNYSIILERY